MPTKTIGDRFLDLITFALWPLAWILGREFVLWSLVVVLIGCVAGTLAQPAENWLWLMATLVTVIVSFACNFARELDKEDEEDQGLIDDYLILESAPEQVLDNNLVQ